MKETSAALPEPYAADLEVLSASLPHAVLGWSVQHGMVRVRVDRRSIADVLRVLRDDEATAYRFFSECMATDFLDTATRAFAVGRSERFELVYNVVRIARGASAGGGSRRLFVVVSVADSYRVVPSVVSVFPGAAFPEREIYDMFGIRFTGHPDLRRLLMSDDWIGHPQLKDYPLGGERVQFPSGTSGPAVAEPVVQHPGESFFGLTESRIE